MCQGVVISLVKFQVNGKQKQVILSGVGSHSQLFKDGAARLTRLGWRAGLEEGIVSIESDFSGWNRFSVESGTPTKRELTTLKRAYKKVAGNGKVLIAHVRRIGKIDDALLELFRAQALAEYDKVSAPAWAEYNKVSAPALAEYDKVAAQALAEYNKVKAPALAEYNKVKAPALAEYNKVKAKAWCKLFTKKSNRVKRLR